MWIDSNSILSKKLTVNVLQQARWVICPSGLFVINSKSVLQK